MKLLTPELMERYRKRFRVPKRLEDQHGIYGYFQFSRLSEPTEKDWHGWGKLNPSSIPQNSNASESRFVRFC